MAAQTGILWIEGRDVATDFLLAVTGLSGFPGALASSPRTVPLLTGPEMSGALLDPRLMTRASGRASVSGIILADTTADALALLDALKGLCAQGEVSITTAYARGRHVLAVLDRQDGVSYTTGRIDGLVSVTLDFIVKDGVGFQTAPDVRGLSTAWTACPIGTAVSSPVVLIHGAGAAFTNPVITVRNAGGDVVQTMGFTFSGGADDALRVDSARALVSKIASGVVTDGASYWTAGDYPLLRPCDGNAEAGAYPTVALSSATGTAFGMISYRRRFV